MNKGVAPILATVLIVLVVIALAGSFLIWSGRTITTTTERGTQEAQRVSGATQESVAIIALACGATDSITVKNRGSTIITTSELNVFEDDVKRTVTWGLATLNPNDVTATTSTFGAFDNNGLEAGDVIRVTTVKGASDSARCP